jgi:hypothetical protein
MDRRTAEGSPGLRFLKMHGLGNDFVIIDARGPSDPVTLATPGAVAAPRLLGPFLPAWRAVWPYRDHHSEPLEARFGLEPQTGRRAALGHEPTFAACQRSVWNATVNRHSAPKVG